MPSLYSYLSTRPALYSSKLLKCLSSSSFLKWRPSRSRRHSCRVVLNEDILLLIFLLLDTQSLRACEHVSIVWRDISRSVEHSIVSIHQIIATLPEYRKEWSSTSALLYTKVPGWNSWGRFRTEFSGHICFLDLDISRLHASRQFLAATLDSISGPINLPRLSTLLVTANDDDIEISIVMKFLAKSIRYLVLDIKPSSNSKERLNYVRNDGLKHMSLDSPSRRPPAFEGCSPLSLLLAEFPQAIPELYAIKINVKDEDQMALILEPIMEVLHRLIHLEVVAFPAYALSIPVTTELSMLGNIRHIYATTEEDPREEFEFASGMTPNFSLPQVVSRYKAVEPSPRLSTAFFTAHIRDLVPFLAIQFNPAYLTSLAIVLCGKMAPTDTLLHDLFSTVAARCYHLEDLSVAFTQETEHNRPWYLTYEDLEPLQKCTAVASVAITCTFHIEITEFQLEHLISHWPSLEHLYLGPSNPSFARLPERMSLSLCSTLSLLAKYCPRLRSLILYGWAPLYPLTVYIPSYYTGQPQISDSQVREVTLGIGTPNATLDMVKDIHLDIKNMFATGCAVRACYYTGVI